MYFAACVPERGGCGAIVQPAYNHQLYQQVIFRYLFAYIIALRLMH